MQAGFISLKSFLFVGPAAVASMSAAPKSAVATPILRTPHSSGMALAPSSMMALHAPVRVSFFVFFSSMRFLS